MQRKPGRPCADPDARRVALSLLARGIGSPAEIAVLAGVSRQVVEQWVRRAGVDWQRIAKARLVNAWNKGMRDDPRLAERPKARGRKAHRR